MARPLKVGVQLPEVEYEPRWTDLAEMARLAEDIGLDSVWVGDHYLYRHPQGKRGPWEAFTQLAAIAAVTSRVEIGPLVASTSFHEPGVLAKMAMTIEEISGGRLILGLGAGWNETEYRAFGFPFDHRVSRFEEAFTIIRTLLREGAIDFEGRYYTLRDCELLPRGPRPAGPPLLIGSSGPRVLRITMPYVDSWNAWYGWFQNDPANVPEQYQAIEAACADVGRDPTEVERTVAVYVALPGATGARAFDRDEAQPVAGSPAEIARTLRAFADVGISHIQLVIDPITPAGVESLAPVLEALDAGHS
jgi:alkanesulfonate monooxygenase SsuD/methylene tetrahydromethanopterin reductase-like flavin-dependent oxidoreductase (luciferase family)